MAPPDRQPPLTVLQAKSEREKQQFALGIVSRFGSTYAYAYAS